LYNNPQVSPPLTLLLLNAQSITAKKASFGNLLNEHNPDIIAISETWLNPDISSSEFLPLEYNIFRKDRSDDYGGILLACHNSLNCQILTCNSDSEAIACQLTSDVHESFIICVFYQPPNRSLECITNLYNYFKTIMDHYPHSPIWIAGDLNLPNIDWEINHINGSAYPSNLCETIIELILEYGLTQSVNTATRENNILDVFFTNRPSLIKSCYTIPGISDHEAVLIKPFITITLQQPKLRKIILHEAVLIKPFITITLQQRKLRKIILWNKADISTIKEIIAQFSDKFFNKFSISTPIDILWEEFKSLYSKCISSIPTKPFRTSNSQPWISSYIR